MSGPPRNTQNIRQRPFYHHVSYRWCNTYLETLISFSGNEKWGVEGEYVNRSLSMVMKLSSGDQVHGNLVKADRECGWCFTLHIMPFWNRKLQTVFAESVLNVRSRNILLPHQAYGTHVFLCCCGGLKHGFFLPRSSTKTLVISSLSFSIHSLAHT